MKIPMKTLAVFLSLGLGSIPAWSTIYLLEGNTPKILSETEFVGIKGQPGNYQIVELTGPAADFTIEKSGSTATTLTNFTPDSSKNYIIFQKNQ